MLWDPLFLSQEDLISLKKDTCIFCNSKFNTKLIEQAGTERRGSHYTEHHVDVLRRTYLISDLNTYHFDFKFDEESENYLKLKETETVEKLKSKKLEKSPRLRKKLESKLSSVNIPKSQKKIAINAILDDYLSELNNLDFGRSMLQCRISSLFSNIKFEDLSLIFNPPYVSADYSERSNDTKFDAIRCYCKPRGLKTHKECWPRILKILYHFLLSIGSFLIM